MSLSNTFFLFGEIITDQYCWNQNIREIACPSVSNFVDVCFVNDKSLAFPCQEKHIRFDHCKCWLSYEIWQSLYFGCFPYIPGIQLSYKGKSVYKTLKMTDTRWNCNSCLLMPFSPFIRGTHVFPRCTGPPYWWWHLSQCLLSMNVSPWTSSPRPGCVWAIFTLATNVK